MCSFCRAEVPPERTVEQIPSSLSEILEYFFSPNREYSPGPFRLNMYDTETIEANKFQTAHYTPNCWFDSAVPFGFSNGSANFLLDVMYMKDVHVNELPHDKKVYPALQDTSLWKFVLSIIKKKEVSKPGSVESISLSDGDKIPTILCRSLNTSRLYDEAPLFRILLLLDCLQSPKCHDRYDYTAQNLFFQSYGFTTSISWLQEINDTNKGDNAPGLHSSVIRCVTLSYYEKMLLDTVQRAFCEHVVVPVSQTWSRCSWLFPYIASFTTTAWWNFGLVIRTQILDSTTGQPYGNDSILSFPEASTVYVPGEFENILLVLIDSESKSDFFVGTLEIPITDENFDHPVNFSLPFYKYLGRHGAACYPYNVSINNKFTVDVQEAMKVVVDTVCMPGVLQRCISMISETCRLRYHNNWVIPSRNPIEKKKSDPTRMLFENAGHSYDYLQKIMVINSASDDDLASMMKSMSVENSTDISQSKNSKSKVQSEYESSGFSINCLSGPGLIDHLHKFRLIHEINGYDWASEMQTLIEERSTEFSKPVILKLEAPPDNALDSVVCDSQTFASKKAFKNFLRKRAEAEMINAIKKETLESKKKNQICRYFTPIMNLTEEQQRIGDRDLPSVSTLSDEHLANLKIAAFLRVSPMHVVPSSCIRIQNGHADNNDRENVPMPCFHTFQSREFQYNITEASGQARILIALSRQNKNQKIRQIDASALTLEITDLASICGAVAEWTISYNGINFFDMNKLTRISAQLETPNKIDEFWPSYTHNFISRPVSGSNYFVTEISRLIRQRIGIENLKIDNFHGGLLPWWYVCAVAAKFDHIFPANPEIWLGEFGEAISTLELGFYITSDHQWYTFPFYTSNNQYDNPMFQNYNIFYLVNGTFVVEPLAWYPDAYIDATRLTQSLRLKSPAPKQPKYFCEILTTPLETSRQVNKTLVSHSCPVQPIKKNIIPHLNHTHLNMLFENFRPPPPTIKNFSIKKVQSDIDLTETPVTKSAPPKMAGKGGSSTRHKKPTNSEK